MRLHEKNRKQIIYIYEIGKEYSFRDNRYLSIDLANKIKKLGMLKDI